MNQTVGEDTRAFAKGGLANLARRTSERSNWAIRLVRECDKAARRRAWERQHNTN